MKQLYKFHVYNRKKYLYESPLAYSSPGEAQAGAARHYRAVWAPCLYESKNIKLAVRPYSNASQKGEF